MYKRNCTTLHVAILENQSMAIFALYPHTNTKLKNRPNENAGEYLITCIKKNILEKSQTDLEKDIRPVYAFLLAGADITQEMAFQAVSE
jgi:hypothetical protein